MKKIVLFLSIILGIGIISSNAVASVRQENVKVEESYYEFTVTSMFYEEPRVEILVEPSDKPILHYAYGGKNIGLTVSSLELLDEKFKNFDKKQPKTVLLICDDIEFSPKPKIAKKVCKKVKRYIVKEYGYPRRKIKILLTDYD